MAECVQQVASEATPVCKHYTHKENEANLENDERQ